MELSDQFIWNNVFEHNGIKFRGLCVAGDISYKESGEPIFKITVKQLHGNYQDIKEAGPADFEDAALKMVIAAIKYADGLKPGKILSLFI
jgi:hypothetical protein